MVTRFLGATVALLLLLITGATAAGAQDDPFGSEIDDTNDDTTSDSTNSDIGGAAVVVEVSASTTVDGERVEILNTDTQADPMTASLAANRERPGSQVAIEWPPCAEHSYWSFDIATFTLAFHDPPICLEQYAACGAERIDDMYFGEISGGFTGAYGDFLQHLIDGIMSIPGITDIDVDLVNASFLGRLPAQPDELALPVFHWCRHQDGTYDWDDPQWGIEFVWDTSIDDEYPVVTVLARLTDSVVERIGLYEPVVDTVPPLESGHTFVKFPTWLGVDKPFSPVHANQISDLVLIEVEVQATLRHVRFDLGDTTATCTIEQMATFDPETMDAIDDAPECHLTFDEVTEFAFSATLTYDLEQRIRQRRYDTKQWPAVAWTPHTTQPVVEITRELGDFGVHELLSLNTSTELALGQG